MNMFDIIQIAVYTGLLILLTPPLGVYMARVFAGERTILSPILSPLEKLICKLGGVDPAKEMNWLEYSKAVIIFSALSLAAVFLMQVLQAYLPLNPDHLGSVEWTSALNTAVSFMTNTNWQGYAGETTMSFFTQMLGLAVQNFLSAAAGIGVFLALARGISRKTTDLIGNFWADLVRCIIYVLLPLSLVLAFVLVSQGVVQNFSATRTVTTLEGAKQGIPMGPAASQIAIKQLGTNGGGFFNANSAHPFENPTPLSNFLEAFAILLIPAALVYTYGIMIKDKKHAWVLYAVMLAIWAGGLGVSLYSEHDASVRLFNGRPLMEGKETRFGVTNSLLWATATTVASNGSVNAMHSSLSPLAGGMAMFNMHLGEIIFGGVGSGMYGMLFFVLMTVFLAGLMVGRTPEYLGKKIEKREVQMAMIGMLGPGALMLIGTAAACVLPAGLASLSAKGPHGFSEMLYAYTSAAANNGSAFAGLNANTHFYNLTLAFNMLAGRFICLLPALAIAGSLAGKKSAPPSAGTFSTGGFLFALLLTGVIIIVGVLTFVPALVLGPVLEHMLMVNGIFNF
ncbi:MAG: potassium-transporting ATPase subunit KdpA [Elusimicrobia bacterium]|nr:potassium-transporting ATPase subunit KdpA [Elusimicrobiota bacterium]